MAGVKRRADQMISDEQFCGIAWQFSHDQDVLESGQAGWLDAPGGTPLPEDALYRIYSMTKPIVSVLALQLLEEGALRLTDPVAYYLPEFANMKVLHPDGVERPAQTLMCVEHLLTHRSGLSYDFLPRCEVAAQYQDANLMERADRNLQDFVQTISGYPLAFEPGTQWRYSVSIDVLGRVLEEASGRSLEVLMEDRIFKPCGMKDTGFTVAQSQQHRLAAMYGARRLGQVPKMSDGPQTLTTLDVSSSHPLNAPDTFVRGGHGLYSTTQDYQKFLPVLMKGLTPSGERLLSPVMLDAMWVNRIPLHQQPLAIGDGPMPGYGWNLTGRVMVNLGSAYSLTLPDEGGWSGAASTYFFVHRGSGLNGIVMTQYLGSMIPIADDLRGAFLQALEY